MKDNKNYIPFVHRCIAYVLLISQTLISCGSPIPVDPQQQDTVPVTETLAAEQENVQGEEAEPVVEEEAQTATSESHQGDKNCLTRCMKSAGFLAERTGDCLRSCGTATAPRVRRVGERLSLASEAARPRITEGVIQTGEGLRNAEERLTQLGREVRRGSVAIARNTSCGGRVLGVWDDIINGLNNIHEPPNELFFESDDETTNPSPSVSHAAVSPEVPAPTSSATHDPDKVVPVSVNPDPPVSVDAAGPLVNTDVLPTVGESLPLPRNDIEQGLGHVDSNPVPDPKPTCKERLQGCQKSCIHGMHACRKRIRHFQRVHLMGNTKFCMLFAVTPAVLVLTAFPHLYGLGIDSTGCKYPGVVCKVKTNSFTLTYGPHHALQNNIYSLGVKIEFYNNKRKAIEQAWCQQQPCASILLPSYDQTNPDNQTTLAQKHAAYVSCVDKYGVESSNKTEGFLQYLATESRNNPEKLDKPILDDIASAIAANQNDNLKSNLAEFHRLEANTMGEDVKATEQFQQGILDKIKQDTTNQIALPSLMWHVTARVFAFASCIHFMKLFARAGATVDRLAQETKTEEGAEVYVKVKEIGKLVYNSHLEHSVKLAFVGSALIWVLCGFMHNRELLYPGATYTLTPKTSQILDTAVLGVAFVGLKQIHLHGHTTVERIMALTSLVSTAIWATMLVNSLKVDVQGNGCGEPGSLAALVAQDNTLRNMLKAVASSDMTRKMMDIVVSGNIAGQLQQTPIQETQLPMWCTDTDSLKQDLISDAKAWVLCPYITFMVLSPLWTLMRGYTHNALICFAQIMWLARSVFAYNQSMLNLPFVAVRRSLPLAGFLESLSMAIVLASSVYISTGERIPIEQAEEETGEEKKLDMGMEQTQTTVMGGVDSVMEPTGTGHNMGSSGSTPNLQERLEEQVDEAGESLSFLIRRMFSGLGS